MKEKVGNDFNKHYFKTKQHFEEPLIHKQLLEADDAQKIFYNAPRISQATLALLTLIEQKINAVGAGALLREASVLLVPLSFFPFFLSFASHSSHSFILSLIHSVSISHSFLPPPDEECAAFSRLLLELQRGEDRPLSISRRSRIREIPQGELHVL